MTSNFERDMQRLMTRPDGKIAFSGPESYGDQPIVGINPHQLLTIDDFVMPSEKSRFTQVRGALLTGTEDEITRIEVLEAVARRHKKEFMETDMNVLMADLSHPSLRRAQSKISEYMKISEDSNIVVVFSGVDEVFAKPRHQGDTDRRSRLELARSFSGYVSGLLDEYPNLAVCAISDCAKLLPKSLLDEDVFGGKLKIDLPKLEQRKEIISATIGDLIVSSMFVSSVSSIDTAEVGLISEIARLTKGSSSGTIQTIIFSAIKEFEARKSAVSEEAFDYGQLSLGYIVDYIKREVL